jgi:hypothetical protein
MISYPNKLKIAIVLQIFLWSSHGCSVVTETSDFKRKPSINSVKQGDFSPTLENCIDNDLYSKNKGSLKTGENGQFSASIKFFKNKNIVNNKHSEPCSSVVILNGNKQVIEIGGNEDCNDLAGNTIEYRFMPLLKETDFCVISSRSFRNLRTYIVALKPEVKNIFDSNFLHLDVLRICDINGDNKAEIIANFNGLNGITVCPDNNYNVPLIFELDEKKSEFIVANKKFREVIIKEINRLMEEIEVDYKEHGQVLDNNLVISRTISIIASYELIGDNESGWSFLSNQRFISESIKKEIQSQMKRKLFEDQVCRQIFKQ